MDHAKLKAQGAQVTTRACKEQYTLGARAHKECGTQSTRTRRVKTSKTAAAKSLIVYIRIFTQIYYHQEIILLAANLTNTS